MQDFFEDIECKHIKLIRKKGLLWQCTKCESFFTVQIQNDDRDYIWLKTDLMKSDVEKYIESWWCRNNHDVKTPNQTIKDKICQISCDLDSNIRSIVHVNKKDVEEYAKKIQSTQNELKKWFYILHCFDIGKALQNKDEVMGN
jgi:hypothetical protein